MELWTRLPNETKLKASVGATLIFTGLIFIFGIAAGAGGTMPRIL